MAAQTAEQLRELIRRDTAELAELAKKADDVTKRRLARMRQARALGAMLEELAEDTGYTPGRISQLAPKPGRKKHGQAPEPEPVAFAGPAPLADDGLPPAFQPGVTAGVRSLLSNWVTDGWSKRQSELETVFVDTSTGAWSSTRGHRGRIEWRHRSVADLLQQLPAAVERVYMVGTRPGQEPDQVAAAGGIPEDGTRCWFLGPLDAAPGWSYRDNTGPFFPQEGSPMGHYSLLGREVTVTLAAEWFGGGEYSVTDAAEAWARMRELVADGFNGAILLTTPATTGRDLWRRTIGKDRSGKGKEYPVLSDELRALIKATSGQGRWEVIPEGPQEIPMFTQWDMRFAYSALAWGLPVGAPEMVTGQQWDTAPAGVRERLLNRRGRWLITATVPAGWEHVGILPAPSTDGRWVYPRKAGQTFTTWATGSELLLAAQHGWQFIVREGFHFTEGKPLDEWKKRLTALYQTIELSEWGREHPAPAALVRKAMRNMVLMAIGAFGSRVHNVTRTAPMTPAGEKLLPDTAPVRIIGNAVYAWEEPGQRSEWMQRMDHPEWSAEIYGRCRARLLECPTGVPGQKVGALHVAPGDVIGMRTDALYLACDPGWPDDGAVGRLRLEARLTGPVPRPHTDAELGALKSRSEVVR